MIRQWNQVPTEAEVDAMMTVVERITELKVPPTKAETLFHTLQAADEMAPIFFERSWTLLRSRKPFLTSDQPVTFWVEPTDENRMYGVGALTADEIYFLLDPFHCLTMGEVLQPELLTDDADTGRVRQINAAVAHRSNLWIYHRPKDDPLAGLDVSREGPVMHINGIPARQGVDVWNTLRGSFLSGDSLPFLHIAYSSEGPEVQRRKLSRR